VKLVLQNTRQESLDLPDLTLKAMPLGIATSQLDLHWNMSEEGEDLWLKLTYSTDLFDEPLIDRLLEQYDFCLRAFAERPELRLGELATEIAQTTRSRRAKRGQELRSMDRGKLRSLRRQAAEPTER
jgi:non-ribosomal peptide synthetase component F